jgi:cellulose biosynthesis protein BcsQ
VGGIKGGSGKTTVATNLAVLLNHAGRDVLLVDSGTTVDGLLHALDQHGYSGVEPSGTLGVVQIQTS